MWKIHVLLFIIFQNSHLLEVSQFVSGYFISFLQIRQLSYFIVFYPYLSISSFFHLHSYHIKARYPYLSFLNFSSYLQTDLLLSIVTITNNAPMNIVVQVSVCTCFHVSWFFMYICAYTHLHSESPQHVLPPHFLKNCQIVFQNDCTTLHSPQQGMKIPHPCQYLLFSGLWFLFLF